ncbi:hypothetical protein AA0229_1265 [Gluconobacter cerinus NRIC 0229]|nr:hypothetical protein AA0229_1265 [Gluconobacter cerinus NRIC 0229]
MKGGPTSPVLHHHLKEERFRWRQTATHRFLSRHLLVVRSLLCLPHHRHQPDRPCLLPQPTPAWNKEWAERGYP